MFGISLDEKWFIDPNPLTDQMICFRSAVVNVFPLLCVIETKMQSLTWSSGSLEHFSPHPKFILHLF